MRGMTKSIVCLAVLAAVSAYAAPQVMKTRFPTRDVVIVEEVLTSPIVVGRGENFAPTLQAAVDKVGKAGGGTVFLAAGEYLIGSRVVVREGVTVRGDFSAADARGGTLLRIVADRGNEDAPATFSVERGGGLAGLTFWYPDQRVPNPVPYPWTVKNAEMGANDNLTVADCAFVNAWKAIRIGPDGNELHTFRNIRICALKTGISIDSTTDIGRMSEVTVAPEVWTGSGLPGAPEAGALGGWLLGNDTVAVDIGRSDWEYIWRLTVRGYRRGLVFRKGARGTTNAVMAESDITGCTTALEADALNEVGFSAYRCGFAGMERAFVGTERFDAVVQFHSCVFKGGLLENRGTGMVTFHACDIRAGVLAAERGQVSAMGCGLSDVRLGRGVARARLLGFDGKTARIVNDAEGGDVVIEANHTFPDAGAPVQWAEPAARPRPVSDALFVVTEFGASPEKEDNAAAFQAALDKAGANTGGGTVYVPAGMYMFKGDITVPAGVELRGCSDVPHHTVSAGSVLMPVHNKGREDGAPFVSLRAGAGLRGLTFWYPEQPLKAPVPYPWTVRALGEKCWMVDVTIGNAWQGADFATHPSDGHFISYLAGSMYRRGLFVGNCKGRGWVEDLQFNPHYAARLPEKLPRVYGEGAGDAGGRIIQFQREHLEGVVFRDCGDEMLRGTFLFAALDGIAFHGKVNASVLMHGTDTGSRAAYFRTDEGATMRFALAQLVALGDWVEAAVVTAPENKGRAEFYNTQIWAGPRTAKLEGGAVRFEQFNTVSGPVEASGGSLSVVNGVFKRSLSAHVTTGKAVTGEVAGTVSLQGPLRVADASRRMRAFANSFSLRPAVTDAEGKVLELASGFEVGEPEAVTDTVATPGGGIRQMAGNRCGAVEREDAHSGKRAVLLSGVPDEKEHSFVYHVMFKEPVFVMPDTVLTYWIKPLNESGRSTGIDLHFADGKTLRQSGLADTDGVHTFPGIKRGRLGAWTKITVPLGKFAGNTVTTVMAAYDVRRGEGRFESLFDDVRIAPELQPAAWQVRTEPAGGRVAHGAKVSLVKDDAVQVRYTLDGTTPNADSPLYGTPIILDRKGRAELQYMPLTADGQPSQQVFGIVYDVQ